MNFRLKLRADLKDLIRNSSTDQLLTALHSPNSPLRSQFIQFMAHSFVDWLSTENDIMDQDIKRQWSKALGMEMSTKALRTNGLSFERCLCWVQENEGIKANEEKQIQNITKNANNTKKKKRYVYIIKHIIKSYTNEPPEKTRKRAGSGKKAKDNNEMNHDSAMEDPGVLQSSITKQGVMASSNDIGTNNNVRKVNQMNENSEIFVLRKNSENIGRAPSNENVESSDSVSNVDHNFDIINNNNKKGIIIFFFGSTENKTKPAKKNVLESGDEETTGKNGKSPFAALSKNGSVTKDDNNRRRTFSVPLADFSPPNHGQNKVGTEQWNASSQRRTRAQHGMEEVVPVNELEVMTPEQEALICAKLPSLGESSCIEKRNDLLISKLKLCSVTFDFQSSVFFFLFFYFFIFLEEGG
ncbi:bromodomain-containing protein, partial [Reticulomyxa filosa]